MILKTFFFLPLRVMWKWHKTCSADNSKAGNLPFLTPDFPYNQGLLVIFNDFIDKYRYSILEIHKNNLETLFIFTAGGRVKMARRAARGTFQKWPILPFWPPDFTYFEALQIIFNVFTAIYMYYIPEKHRNSLKNIFPLASGGGVKMA